MKQFVWWLKCLAVLGWPTVVGCHDGETRTLPPRPDLGVVHAQARECAGTRLGPGEVIASASCLGFTPASELTFTALRSGETRAVKSVVYSQDPEPSLPSDWALLLIDEPSSEARIETDRRALSHAAQPQLGAHLWWAGVSHTGNQIRVGRCVLTDVVSPESTIDSELLEHDCSTGEAMPGVLLYTLDADVVNPIAFDAGGHLAVPATQLAAVPLPAYDLATVSVTLGVGEAPTIFAVDGFGYLSRRKQLGARWYQWQALSTKQPLVRLDAAAETLDFTGWSIDHLWAVNESRQLLRFDLQDERAQVDDSMAQVVDVAVASSVREPSRLFVLTDDSKLCARVDPPTASSRWDCLVLEGEALALDAIASSTGYEVLVTQATDLLTLHYATATWSAVQRIGEQGLYKTAAIGKTASGALYVAALSSGKLRLRAADSAASSWTDWQPLYGAGITADADARLTALDGSTEPDGVRLLAILNGEVVMSLEQAESTIDGWLANPRKPAAFSAWSRLPGH